MAHHKLGPSAAHRWLRCPGSVAATADLEDKGSIYAAEGSAAHHVAEQVLTGECELADMLGRVVSIDGFDITVEQDMLDHVEAYIARIDELGEGEGYVEEAVPLSPAIPDGFGTADHVHLAEPVLTVTDLKYGKGVRVDAEGNEQLMLYGYGAVMRLHPDRWIDTVVLRIDQPRIDHVSEWAISVEQLLRWATETVAPAVEAAQAEDAPRIPGETQCRWCAFKPRCPELRAEAAGALARFPAHADLETQELADALKLANMVVDWAKAIEARAYQEMTAGAELDGFKLVHGRSSRDWADTAEAERVLRRLLKVDGAMPRKLISPAQAEKALGKQYWGKVADLVAVKPGKPTIAPADDKRAAISPAESVGFADISSK